MHLIIVTHQEYLFQDPDENNYPDIPHPCPSFPPYIPPRPHWLMGFSSPQRVAKMTKRLVKMIMDEAGITSIKP